MLAALVGSPAEAHQGSTGQDYTKFRQQNGASCCNAQDCRPVGYRLRPDGDVVMYPEGRAIIVPQRLLNETPSDDGRAHWCGIRLPSGNLQTFCAILPRQMTRWQAPSRGIALEASASIGRALAFLGWRPPFSSPGEICRSGR
ncbi:MAG: hypothetical protein AB7F78_22155 [Hyphomicrobiaceae bacterium]